jgi:ribosomal protein S18 acetylase RimI-like enzyme
MSVGIRPATPDDAAPIARVHVDAWRAAYRGLVPDEFLDGLDCDRRAQRVREWLASGEGVTYAAEEGGQVLGFLTLGACRDEDVEPGATGEIWGIYLAPARWRRGIGRALCRYAEEWLRAQGYRLATLWVFAGNGAARRFYEAMGFAPDGGSKTLDFGVPLEAVRYRKALWRPLRPEAARRAGMESGPTDGAEEVRQCRWFT